MQSRRLDVALGVKGHVAAERVVQQHAEGVDVGTRVDRLARRLLGREVVAGAEHAARDRQARLLEHAGDAEVGQLRLRRRASAGCCAASRRGGSRRARGRRRARRRPARRSRGRRASGSRPSSAMRSRRSRPRTYSNTMNGRPWSSPRSITVTIPGCARLASVRASRSKRSTASALSSRRMCSIFTATSRSSTSSRASQTADMPPRPRSLVTR